jgi:hypothetical protein
MIMDLNNLEKKIEKYSFFNIFIFIDHILGICDGARIRGIWLAYEADALAAADDDGK